MIKALSDWGHCIDFRKGLSVLNLTFESFMFKSTHSNGAIQHLARFNFAPARPFPGHLLNLICPDLALALASISFGKQGNRVPIAAIDPLAYSFFGIQATSHHLGYSLTKGWRLPIHLRRSASAAARPPVAAKGAPAGLLPWQLSWRRQRARSAMPSDRRLPLPPDDHHACAACA